MTSSPHSIIIKTIMRGGVDASLDRIVEAVRERRRVLDMEKLAEIEVGDLIEFNSTVKPRYLKYAPGKVTGVEGDRVVVDLDYRIRRFHTGIKTPVNLITVTGKS